MKQSKKPPIPQDDLVEKLVPNAGNVETYQMLYGWVGKSTRSGYVRLYEDLDMKSYVEFQDKDVRLTEPMKTQSDPLGGTMVWLDKEAEIITTNSSSGKEEAAFLSGQFMASLDKVSEGFEGLDASAELRARPSRFFCPSRFTFCPSRFGCPSRYRCPSRFLCPPEPMPFPRTRVSCRTLCW